jgi:hypothetical protein
MVAPLWLNHAGRACQTCQYARRVLSPVLPQASQRAEAETRALNTISPVSGTATLEELRAVLGDGREACVRVAFTRPEELRVFEITLGGSPPCWRDLDWTYPGARLAAFVADGPTVATWLAEGEVNAFDFKVSLDGLGPNAITDRRQSRAETGGREPLDWPSDEWTVPLGGVNVFAGELISTIDAPSFASFDRAVANLLGLTRTTPHWSMPSPELVVRRQDTRARISRVFVGVDTLEVAVEGDDLAGSILELAGDPPGEARTLIASGPATELFEVPAGLPLGAWLVLRRSGQWLDRRSLSHDGQLRPEAGVEYAAPADGSSDDEPFSAEEQLRIRQAVSNVKTALRGRPELDARQLAELDSRLDRLADTSTKLTRREWKVMVYGTALTLIAEHIVTKEAAHIIFGLLARELPHLFVLPLALPGV